VSERPTSWSGSLALAALCASLGFSLAVSAQRPVFRSEVHTVAVYATVQDSEGRLVPDVPRDAFQIFEDGRPVEITTFSRDPQPLRVAVMLDVSWSGGPDMSQPGKGAAELRNSVLAFMRALGPDDRASLGTFGGEIAVGANLTNDLAEFGRVLREEYWTGPGAGTPLWQAVSEATASLASHPGRHVVLFYTDGHDSGSLPNWRGNRSAVERQLVQQDAMVYVVRPAWWHREVRLRTLPGSVRELAAASGGGYFEVPQGADLPAAFTRVAEELRHQYLLGFSPAVADGQAHRIEVRVSRPDLKVRARSSHAARPVIAAEPAVRAPDGQADTSSGRVGQLKSEVRTEGPLTAVVLLDATWTVANIMAPFVWDGSRDAHRQPMFKSGRRLPHRPADLFSAGLQEGLFPRLQAGDRLRLGTISRQLRLSPTFTGNRAELIAAARDVLKVPDADRYGPSPIWDAVDGAVTLLEGEAGRRAIVLVTDGMPTGNRIGLRQVERRAALSGIPVYVLGQSFRGLGPGDQLADRTGNPWMFLFNPLGHSAETMLKSLAAASGGAYFVDDSRGRVDRNAEGKYYPDPSSGRSRTLVRQFDLMMREIQKARTARIGSPPHDRSDHGSPARRR
jgi:Ca-activated chloride channel homolog